MTGVVVDQSGAVVPGAIVTATAMSGVPILTRTNAAGHYVLGGLLIGVYRVAIEAPGFKRAVSESVEVHANARVRLDVQLELGPVTGTVTVRPPTPQIQTDTSSLASVLSADQISELPVNGRNVQQLAWLAAGIVPAVDHVDREAGFNAHGQWALQNNFILDGVDNNSHVMGVQDRKAQVLVPNLDAVQEFQLLTSNYSAEFGRSAGAVVNVSIKAGTNAVRGTVHQFLRHDVFDARNAFDYHDRTNDGKADPDLLRQHQYGFTIGGPIRKDRTFVFASLERTRIHTTESTLVSVPSSLERLGIFDPETVSIRDPVTGSPFPGNVIPPERWDSVAARMARLWPDPNFSGATRANYVSSPVEQRRRSQYRRSDRPRRVFPGQVVRPREPDGFPGRTAGSAPRPCSGRTEQ